jgi:hypothetical protein
MSDQLVARISTYAGQHNTETERQTSMPRAGLELMIAIPEQPEPKPWIARTPDRHSKIITTEYIVDLLDNLTTADYNI